MFTSLVVPVSSVLGLTVELELLFPPLLFPWLEGFDGVLGFVLPVSDGFVVVPGFEGSFEPVFPGFDGVGLSDPGFVEPVFWLTAGFKPKRAIFN